MTRAGFPPAMRPAAIAVVVGVVLCLLPGCRGSAPATRDPVDLAKARCAPGHDRILVDGKRTTEAEWDGAVTVPFMNERASARFLWDADGIYGFLNSGVRFPNEPGAWICVSLTSATEQEFRCVFLYFSRSPLGGKVELSRAVAGHDGTTLPLDPGRVRVAATQMRSFDPLGQWWQWSTEFFLSWSALGRLGGPPVKLEVHVFAVLAERPASLLRLR